MLTLNRQYGDLIFALECLAVSVLITSCGLSNDSVSESSSVACTPDINSVDEATRSVVFQGTVWPLVKDRCSTCHGASQSPKFATSDLSESYQNAASFLRSLPSRLEVKAGDGHCGTNCQDDTTMKETLSQYMAQLQAKAASCVVESSTSTVMSRVMTVSSSLATITTTASSEVIFAMDTSTGAVDSRWTDVKLSAQIKAYTTPASGVKGSVIVKNIKVLSPNSAVRVLGLYFVVNGKMDELNPSFASSSRDFSPSSSYQELTPSGNSSLVEIGWGSGGETLALSVILEQSTGSSTSGGGTDTGTGSTVTKTENEVFTQDVTPILSSRCFSCHATNGQAAYTKFPMPNNDATTLRANVISRSNKTNPDASLLIMDAIHQNNGHGGGKILNPDNATDAAQLTTIKNWMKTIP